MDEKKIIALFPRIQEIECESLRAQSISALQAAIAQGGWSEQTVALAPVTIGWKNCPSNLIEHINAVVEACMINYALLSPYYAANSVVLDRDTVLCGALLHDLGKFTEFTLKDGCVEHSDTAYLMRHPLAGALIASKAGLPDKIVHLIATHSFEGSASNHTAESSFVRTLDDFVFKCTVSGLEKVEK